MKQNSSQRDFRAVGLLILIGITYFLLSMILAEAEYKNYNISNNSISALGVGVTAVIFDPAVIVLGLLLIVSAYLLQKHKSLAMFSALLFVTGIGAAGVGVFNDTYGAVHTVFSSIAFLGGAFSATYFGVIYRGWIRYPSVFFGLFTFVAFVLLASGQYLGIGFGGMERMVVYPVLIWALIFAGGLFNESIGQIKHL